VVGGISAGVQGTRWSATSRKTRVGSPNWLVSVRRPSEAQRLLRAGDEMQHRLVARLDARLHGRGECLRQRGIRGHERRLARHLR